MYAAVCFDCLCKVPVLLQPVDTLINLRQISLPVVCLICCFKMMNGGDDDGLVCIPTCGGG